METIKAKNTPQKRSEAIELLRGAMEHRGTWMYLLMDEARKQGLSWDDFARKAIFRCGRFHGEAKFSDRENLKNFGESFATPALREVFDMDVVECSEERFIVEFHHCPLLTGWMKQTDNKEDIQKLCDIAMDGDRGIIDTCSGFHFDLQSTIACGDDVCRIVISKES